MNFVSVVRGEKFDENYSYYPVKNIGALTFEDWEKIAFTFFSITKFWYVMVGFEGDALIRGLKYNGEIVESKVCHCDLVTFGWVRE